MNVILRQSLRWAGRFRYTIVFGLITGAAAFLDELFHYAVNALLAFMR